MRWLGLDWDGARILSVAILRPATPRSRTNCSPRGHAYRCYMTQEELAAAARRGAGASAGRSASDSPWRDRAGRGRAGPPFVVRLKAPREGETVIEDQVQGRVAVQNAELDDFVLLRSDGIADLHARRRRRRSRHGRHPCHPRRRPSQQRLPPARHHPGDGLARAGLRPCAADPRPGRRQAVQAPRRARRRWLIATSSASCPRRWSIICFASAGAMATTRSSAARRRSAGSISTHVGRSPSRFDLKKLENLNGHYIREAERRPARRAGRAADRGADRPRR